MKLHQFLYGTEEYIPSQQVKEISASVEEKRRSRPVPAKAPETTEAPGKETKEESRSGIEEEKESSSQWAMPTTEAFDPTAPELFQISPIDSLLY